MAPRRIVFIINALQGGEIKMRFNRQRVLRYFGFYFLL
jgi:hypothetical protein